MPAVLDAGCACWVQGPRSIGNDLCLEHEIALLDVAAGMQHLRALGYRDVVLLGNSDGGALYAFYNQRSRLAPARRLFRTPAGRPTGLAKTELMPAGEFILVSPHPGQSAILPNSLDASVVDESDPFSTDPSLETIRPKGALPGVRYPDEARLREYLGMTEGVIMFAQEGDPAYALDESVGRPVSGWDEVKIVEIGSETEVPDGETGEALFRGPYTIAGYYKSEKDDVHRFTADGFYRSCDLMTAQIIDGKRYFFFRGCTKDVVDRGGEKINAEELENLINRCPTVHASAVVGMPDPG